MSNTQEQYIQLTYTIKGVNKVYADVDLCLKARINTCNTNGIPFATSMAMSQFLTKSELHKAVDIIKSEVSNKTLYKNKNIQVFTHYNGLSIITVYAKLI